MGAPKNHPTIRPFELRDREQVGALKRRYIDPNSHWLERFEWQYVDNPMHDPARPLGWVVETSDGRILGSQMQMPYRFRVFNEQQFVGISMDTFLHQELRGQGLGRKLFQAYFDDAKGGLAVATSANIISERIWLSSDAVVIGDLDHEYVHVHRSSPLVRELLVRKSPTLARLLDLSRLLPVLGSLRDRWSRMRQTRPAPSTRVEKVTAGDPRLDDIWLKYREQHGITVVRERAYRQWRYERAPEPRPSVYLVTQPPAERMAYFVIQPCRVGEQARVHEVIDLFGPLDDPELQRQVLLAALQVSREMNVDALRIKGMHPSWRAHLLGLGFVKRALPSAPFLCKNMGPVAHERIRRFDNWHLCAGDGDLLLE